jgi:DNA phosphorothioation-dependent restriction protein DptH
VVDEREATAGEWQWKTELVCAVATPLHPAVLDMIRQQHTFLAESFCLEASEELTRRAARPFSPRTWSRVTDLARIERPVFGTLMNSAGALDSRVRSYGYFHLVGQCRAESAQLSARLLLEYEDEDDGEEISDSELFGETRSSRLVYHTLMDYRALHAHADDGIAVGAYCGREIQPVVAGIDAFLREVLGDTDRGNRPYGLQVTVFSTGRDDSAVTRWLNAWRDRWQQAELTESTRHYEHCRIAIAYRVVEDQRRQEHLAQLVGETPLAVMFFTDFVEAGTDRFEDLGPSDLSDVGYRQFPVLEKACCAVHSGGRAAQRERVLSHARFGLATLQAEVMARVSRGNVAADQRHVVVSRSDFGPWEEVMAAAHQSCGWVVCIDPAVDDQLLRQGIPEGEARREIIGFGAGVGASGESNYTVSTEQYSLADVRRRLGQQLSARLGPWEPKTQERVAERLVAAASGMAGLSMVKATGPSEYVRDYAAYAALRALLPRDPDALCDEIVSLDAFHHWFDNGVVKSRPDLLRLRVKAVEGHLEVEAQVVECKLAQSSEEVLREASEQVRHGLERLVERFRPRPVGTKIGVGDRPDQR